MTISFTPAPSAVAAVAREWAKGRGSLAIAGEVGLPEADVCRILRRQQDERREARVARLAQRLAVSA